VLAELSGLGEPVTIMLAGRDDDRTVTGTVSWSGTDLVCLDLRGAPVHRLTLGRTGSAQTAYVPLEHIEAVMTG
jgi:hypothetical protein